MEIPRAFVPNNVSEEKLEKLLKEGPRKVERYNPLKYEFYCDVCGELAGIIELILKEERKNTLFFWPTLDPFKPEATMVIQSFSGITKIPVYEESLESIMYSLEDYNLKAVLKKLNGKGIDFYCPTCDKCYCEAHLKSQEK